MFGSMRYSGCFDMLHTSTLDPYLKEHPKYCQTDMAIKFLIAGTIGIQLRTSFGS